MRESMAHVSPIFGRLRGLTGFPNASIRVAVNIAPACLSRKAFMNAKKWLAISVLFVLVIGPSGALQGQAQQQTQTTSRGTGQTPAPGRIHPPAIKKRQASPRLIPIPTVQASAFSRQLNRVLFLLEPPRSAVTKAIVSVTITGALAHIMGEFGSG
jgi:hypothetical protein